MALVTSPFTLLKYQDLGASSPSVNPFPYVTSGYFHTRLRVRLRVVRDQPTFLPIIHYQSPHVPFAIPWFRLRPALKFLKSEHFLSPQSCVTIDFTISGGASRSKVHICLLSLLLSRSRPPRSPRSVDACPFQINGCD
jgi:hypothetical protein